MCCQVSSEDKKAVLEAIKEALEWVEENSEADADEFNDKRKEVRQTHICIRDLPIVRCHKVHQGRQQDRRGQNRQWFWTIIMRSLPAVLLDHMRDTSASL